MRFKIGDYVTIKRKHYDEFWYHEEVMKIKKERSERAIQSFDQYSYYVDYKWVDEDSWINGATLTLEQDHKFILRDKKLKRLIDA